MGILVKVAIVGCGLVGRKRAVSLGSHSLLVCADRAIDRAQSLASDFPGCSAVAEVGEVIERRDVDIVVVATSHDALAETTILAARAGKHVLVEKPAARTANELRPVVEAAREAGVTVKVGFNHRFHPAMQRAHCMFEQGAIGELLYIRARYGHGGRLGYEQEWRADPQRSGGGELLDQGSHLIDLARWFAGYFVEVSGHLGTYCW